MQEENYAFNLNHPVKVKLKEKGYQHLANNHNRFGAYYPKWEHKTPEDFKSKADKDGYTTFQAWNFMEEFGPVTRIGMQDFYETDIIIESKNLKPL